MKRRILASVVSVIFLTLVVMPPCGYAQVLPDGYTVVNGNVMVTTNGQTMNINQASQQAITNWVSFCIANGYTVDINQPGASSVSLNRVTGGNISQIFGNLTSNGQIFLVNPNGVLFGASSFVNAPGLVASTLDISDDNFLSGNYTFLGQGGSVINQGLLSSPGGYVTLLGSSVNNSGTILSDLGTISLAAGEKMTMSLDSQGLVSVVVDDAVTQNTSGAIDAVKNSGTIQANGGKVILTSKALDGVFAHAINNEGIIEARSLENNKGKVYLIGVGENSVVSNIGTIDVSPLEQGAQGGFIELSGSELDFVNGVLETGATGEVLLDPWDILIGDLFELFLQQLSGSVTIQATNDINLNLGNLGGDHILNLFNFGSGNAFTLMAGNNIYMNSSSIVTDGGNIQLLADAPGWYQHPFLPFWWEEVVADGIGTIDLGTGSGLNSNGGNITIVGADIDAATLVDAGSGQVDIEATAGNINLGNNSSVSGAAISVLAYNDINMSGNSSIISSGDVTLSAANNIWVGYIEGQYVSLSTGLYSGFISDIDNDTLLDIKADMLQLKGYNGIGVNTALGLTTDVSNTLSAMNGAGGGIRLTDIGNLNIGYADSSFGNIEITSNGNMNLGYWMTPNISGITAHTGSVTLTSNNGAISDGNGDRWNISTNSLNLSAADGIGSQDMLEVYTNDLTAYNSNSGSIRIKDITGDLYVESVVNESLDGSVELIAFGEYNPCYYPPTDMYVKSVISQNDVYLEATNGSILHNDNGNSYNILSDSAILIAAVDIGSGADPIDLDVNIFSANAGGNIDVTEKDGAVFENIEAGGTISILANGTSTLDNITGVGSVNIQNTTGDLTFAGAVTSTGSGVSIAADNGSVFASSVGPHIIANGDSSILTPHGKITPTGTPLDVDIDGTLSVDLTNYQISNVINAPVPPPMDVFGNMTGTITGGIMIPILTGTMNPSPLNPPGYVYYNGIQIWPPKMISGDGERILSSIEKMEKAYWEILDPYRYASFSQDTPVFYLYHPLEEVDEGAFDDINLDTDAYEFIEGNINLKKEMDPYFGWLDGQENGEGVI